MSYAGCQAALSGVIGILERLFGRMMIMLVTFIINLGLLIFLLIWEQDRYPSYVLYIVAGAIGAVKGVWRIETNCKYRFKESRHFVCILCTLFQMRNQPYVSLRLRSHGTSTI